MLRVRPFAIAAVLVASVTCTDFTAPGGGGGVAVGFAPNFSRAAADIYGRLPLFDVTVTNVHVRLLHADGTVAKDTVVSFGKDSVVLELTVQLKGGTELLTAEVELRDGTTVLFSGEQHIEAHPGVVNPASAAVTLNYTGPGATAKTLA